MAKPASITTGRIVAQYVVGVVDGADADDEPDFIPAQGSVTFETTVGYIPFPVVSGPNPITVLKTRITGILDDEGYLCTPDPADKTKPGARGLRLVSTDNEVASVQGWTWIATPRFVDVNGSRLDNAIPPFPFHLPAQGPTDPPLDLATVVKVPASVGIGTVQAVALAASAQAAATSAAGDAEQAHLAALAAAGVVAGIEANIDAAADRGIQRADIPGKVVQAIAADETVAAAAGAAVSEAVSVVQVALRTDPGMPKSDSAEGLSFAVTDTQGNRTRLEANDRDGGPTEHSLSLDGPALRDYMGFVTAEDDRLPAVTDEEGLAFSVTDAQGQHLWLQANDRDGGPTEHALDMLRRGLGLDAPKETKTTYVTDGDSITQGGHGGGPSWQEELSSLMGGVPITNSGISGTTSLEIAVRQGAWAPILTIPDGQLPAAAGTRVPVIIENMPTDANFWSAVGQPARTYSGTFEGVPVTLTKVKDTTDWTLHRTTSGTAVKAVPRTPFLVNALPQSATRIIWPGRNDAPKSNIREPIDRMARWVTEGGGRFLILSVLSRRSAGDTDPDTQEVAEQNRITQEKYPHEYVNVREFLIRYGMEVAGVTPTAEDLSDQAKNAIPRSLMADNVHPNAAGRLAIGRYLHTQLKIRNLA